MKIYSVLLMALLLLSGISMVSAENEIIIGALIDNTGESATYAPGIEAAIDLAVSDLNDSYEQAGMNSSVKIKKTYVNGTKEDAVRGALELIEEGARIIIGPDSSEEVAGILPVLTEKGILSVNPSTSYELADEDDPIIRLAPSDSKLYRALVAYNNLTLGDTMAAGVILARDDVYGEKLAELMKSRSFIHPSGNASDNKNTGDEPGTQTVLYPPGTRDFTEALGELNALVTGLIDEYGEEHVVVLAVSFDEIADILAQAADYPALSRVRWEGTDSVAMSSALLENVTAARFAADTGLVALSFNIVQPAESDYWRVYDAVLAAGDGHLPGIYEILPYDETLMAAWIVQSNPSTLEEMLYIADSYGKLSYGATGWLKLNKRGDRQYGDYFFYEVRDKGDSTYAWVPVSMFLDESNTLVPLTGTSNLFMERYAPEAGILE